MKTNQRIIIILMFMMMAGLSDIYAQNKREIKAVSFVRFLNLTDQCKHSLPPSRENRSFILPLFCGNKE